MYCNWRRRSCCCCCCYLLLLLITAMQQISINLANDLYHSNSNNNNNNYDNFGSSVTGSSTAASVILAPTSTIATSTFGITNNIPTTATTNIFNANTFVDKNAQHQQQQQQVQPQQQKQQIYQHNQRGGEFSLLDKEVVERLIKQWAPVVWLAPEEQFMPLGVDDFLQNVHPMDKDTKFIPGMPFAEYSKKSFLVTNSEVDELLQNNDSFIYGRNPNEYPVPVYAVVTLCNQLPIETNSIGNDVAQPMHAAATTLNEFQRQDYQEPEQQQQHQINQLPLAQQQLPTQQKALFSIASTRGPYIPITLDPLERHNDTIRRSSRLYPVFQRVRRDVVVTTNNFLPPPLESSMNLMLQPTLLNDYDLAIGEEQKVNTEIVNNLTKMPSSSSSSSSSASAIPIAALPGANNEDPDKNTQQQVNNFIANLADNVKFSGMPANAYEDNNIPFNNNEQPHSHNDVNRQRKMPGFHVTYWMFYPYSQGKTMCTISLGPLGSIPFPAVYGFCLGRRKDIGSHIGDWEHMSLYFNGAAEPEAMYVSAHDAGAYYSYNRLTGSFEFKKQETRKGILQRPNFPKTVTTFNDHPVLFAAKGSHGLWTAPGKHRFVKVARLYDINGFGTPWNTWKAVDITYENLKSYGRSLVPNWLTFKGKWGNPKSKCHPFRRIGLNFCEYTDGPTGIPLKEPHFQCGLTYR